MHTVSEDDSVLFSRKTRRHMSRISDKDVQVFRLVNPDQTVTWNSIWKSGLNTDWTNYITIPAGGSVPNPQRTHTGRGMRNICLKRRVHKIRSQ